MKDSLLDNKMYINFDVTFEKSRRKNFYDSDERYMKFILLFMRFLFIDSIFHQTRGL